MKRNPHRTYYDRGYSDGVQDKRKEGTIPKLLGVGVLSALLIFNQYWVLAFVLMWALFDLQELRNLKKHHDSNPPPEWFDEQGTPLFQDGGVDE